MNEQQLENKQRQEYQRVFGYVSTYGQGVGDDIDRVRYNDPDMSYFSIMYEDAELLSNEAWELLGRYLAKNQHLEKICMCNSICDSKASLLFRGLGGGIPTLKELNLNVSKFGKDGLQSMSAFLRNSPQLIVLLLSCCRGISSEGFEVLVNALDGGSIKRLDLDDCCNIRDISALGNVTLPQLRSLNLTKNSIHNMGSVLALENYTQLTQLFLKHNKIGIDGCRTISKLLQNEETKLEWLDLENNDIDDEGFEILATSLKHNTALNTLRLLDNNISEKGLLVLLKILVDVTSIENTYNSNHTLENLLLNSGMNRKIRRHIDEALTMNRCQPRKGKVIQCQLDSINRAKLAKVQGVSCTDSSVYAQIDPVVLPEVLALVGNECTHGDHDDMYCALVATAADLMSLVNKPVALREQMHDKEMEIAHRNRECKQKVDAIIAENERQTSALTAEISELNKKLQSLTQEDASENITNVDNDGGKKRRRDS